MNDQVNETCDTSKHHLPLCKKDGNHCIAALVFDRINVPRNSKIVSATVNMTIKSNFTNATGYVDLYAALERYPVSKVGSCHFKDLSSVSGLSSAVPWNITSSDSDYTKVSVDLKDIVQQRISHSSYTPCRIEHQDQCLIALFLKPIQDMPEISVFSGDYPVASKRPSISIYYRLPCKYEIGSIMHV